MIFGEAAIDGQSKSSFGVVVTLLFLFVVSFTSCKKDLAEEKQFKEETAIQKYIENKKWEFSEQNGVYHAIQKKKYGYQVAVGDTIAFWYRAYNLSGLVFATNVRYEAYKANLDTVNFTFDSTVWIAGSNTLIEGLERGLLMAREGQQASILFPSAYGFGDNAVGPLVPWSSLIYDIFVIYTKNPSITREKGVVADFIAANEGYSLQTDGFFMKTLTEGLGAVPAQTDRIIGSYLVSNMDGVEVARSYSDTLVLSDSRLPVVVRLAMPLLKEGAEVSVLAPSPLAYGITGTNLVAPYEPVLYKILFSKIVEK